MKSRKVGLALGSGSARGWAHIGVIQALEELGIRVDCVAGTSMGALVGAVYASGTIDALRDFALAFDRKQLFQFFDIVLPKSGLIDGKRAAGFIRQYIQEKNIENMSIPFCCVSADLNTGKEIVLDRGDVIEAVRASISLPGIFTPVIKDGMLLVDGGIVDPVPVDAVRKIGADFVIAVDLNHDIVGKRKVFGSRDTAVRKPKSVKSGTKPAKKINKIMDALNRRAHNVDWRRIPHMKRWTNNDPVPNIFDIMLNSVSIMETQIAATRLKIDPPDIVIRPQLGHIRIMAFDQAEEAITEGYRETLYKLGSLVDGRTESIDNP